MVKISAGGVNLWDAKPSSTIELSPQQPFLDLPRIATEYEGPYTSKSTYLRPQANYLTQAELIDFRSRAEEAREVISHGQINHQKIIEEIFASGPGKPRYLEHPVLQQFVADSKTGDYYKTRTLTDMLQPNFLIAEFEASYYGLDTHSLEAMTFEHADPPENFMDKYPSQAVSITNSWSTKGLANEITVALFGENWKIKNPKFQNDPEAKAKARYIVDKFGFRSNRYTTAIIASPHCKARPGEYDLFYNMRKTTKSNQGWIARWVAGHEHKHRQGKVPRVGSDWGFALKDGRESGAFEELRVDIDVILDAIDDVGTYGGQELAQEVVERVLAERLFRYAIQKNPATNYDSLGSHVLLNYLKEKGAINIDNQNHFSVLGWSELIHALKDFQNEIKNIENEIYQFIEANNLIDKDPEANPEKFAEAQEKILEFMRRYGRPENRKNPSADFEKLAETQKQLKIIEAELKTLEDSGKDPVRVKDLKQQRFKIKKTYYEHFYPLDPFYAALRQTLKKAGIEINSLETFNIRKAAIFDPNPTTIPKDDHYQAPEIIDLAEDLKSYALGLRGDLNREEIDRRFFEGLSTLETKNTPDFILQMLAKTEPSTLEGLDDRLIYYANLDSKNRLTRDDLANYRRLINNKYQNELQMITKSGDKDFYIAKVIRILRHLVKLNPHLAKTRAELGLLSMQSSRPSQRSRSYLALGLLLGLSGTTLLLPSSAHYSNHGQISLADPRVMSQPLSIADGLPHKLENGLILDPSSRNLLARIVPLIRKIAKVENIIDKNSFLAISNLEPNNTIQPIHITKNEHFVQISIYGKALKTILSGNPLTEEELIKKLKPLISISQ